MIFSRRLWTGGVCAGALVLALFFLSGCQSVQEKLEDLFGSSGSSSQGTPLGKEYDGQGGTAITLQPLPVPQSYEKAYSYRTDVADKAMSAFIKRREVDSLRFEPRQRRKHFHKCYFLFHCIFKSL